MEIRNLQLVSISVVAVVLSITVIGILPVTAAAEATVTRDLPDDPIYQDDEISVSLNQSGFYLTGLVTETLPEGFVYRGLASGSGGEFRDYDENTNILELGFVTDTTVTYRVKVGTAAQIENAVFSGTWSTTDSQMEKITGDVTGDNTLTLGEGPKPTPTPTPTATPTPSSNGGGGNGGGTIPTPTPSVTPTATPSTTPSASPGATPPVSPGGMETPTVSPTPSPEETPTPTKKPLIPGFEAVFAIAGLLAVAHLVIRRGRGG